ncbi:YcxB family protein [Lysobacter xanthus]
MEESLPVEFQVRYRLGEYLHLVRARAPANTVFAACTPIQQKLLLGIITVACAFLFFRKSWVLGRCRFRIDELGITRWSKGNRVTHVPWAEVSGVKEFRVGYLLEKGEGGLPVPFRVLSAAQREALQRLVQFHTTQPNNSSKPTPLRGAA